MPFVVHTVPDLAAVVAKWSVHYIEEHMGEHKLRTEISSSNHHMYFKVSRRYAKVLCEQHSHLL